MSGRRVNQHQLSRIKSPRQVRPRFAVRLPMRAGKGIRLIGGGFAGPACARR